ncbi:hypothetical protein B0H17DRAFT_1070677 [Mycena rosella]|uniref:Uncharacterized protein n=1 Tax=Mycena rosella TaxID=1033263 RepID=A0AAD7GG14_MYCRO|nr:hypothetical protein B0H17DRAFT_1070677 [Mycena rosella]
MVKLENPATDISPFTQAGVVHRAYERPWPLPTLEEIERPHPDEALFPLNAQRVLVLPKWNPNTTDPSERETAPTMMVRQEYHDVLVANGVTAALAPLRWLNLKQNLPPSAWALAATHTNGDIPQALLLAGSFVVLAAAPGQRLKLRDGPAPFCAMQPWTPWELFVGSVFSFSLSCARPCSYATRQTFYYGGMPSASEHEAGLQWSEQGALGRPLRVRSVIRSATSATATAPIPGQVGCIA